MRPRYSSKIKAVAARRSALGSFGDLGPGGGIGTGCTILGALARDQIASGWPARTRCKRVRIIVGDRP